MQIYNGKSVFGGIAIGKISVYQKKEQQVKRVKIDDPEQEMARYEKAKAEGIKQLQGLYDKAFIAEIVEFVGRVISAKDYSDNHTEIP